MNTNTATDETYNGWAEAKRLADEIERIEATFPPDSARILVGDINRKLNALLEELCPF